MPDYKLIVRQASDSLLEPIVIQSNDAASAIALAHRHQGEYAELWRNDELLCRMTYAKGGFWIIQAQGAITAEPAAISTMTHAQKPTTKGVSKTGVPRRASPFEKTSGSGLP
jgi:hypothetical protein